MALDSNIGSLTVQSASSVLAQTASGLSSGSNVDLNSGNGMPTNTFSDEGDIQWQTIAAFEDTTNGELHYMGKDATNPSGSLASGTFTHYIFNMSAQTWKNPLRGPLIGSGTTGHIWQPTLDPATGNYYLQRYNSDTIMYFSRSAWVTAGQPNGTLGAVPSYWQNNLPINSALRPANISELNTLTIHPNAFGTGDKGLIVGDENFIWGYCFGNGQWYTLSSEFYPSFPWASTNGGGGAYCPQADIAIVGTGERSGGAGPAWKVPSGTSRANRTTASYGAATPVSCKGGNTQNIGKLIRHPSLTERLLILNNNASGTVYVSDNYGVSWSTAAYTHPFGSGWGTEYSANLWTAATMTSMGVVIGLASKNGFKARMWKPPTS